MTTNLAEDVTRLILRASNTHTLAADTPEHRTTYLETLRATLHDAIDHGIDAALPDQTR